MAGRGRPRAFDPERALRAAMELFWEHGYEGTCIAALTRAMGIGSPSLYATFGNKEQLFTAAVELYGREIGATSFRALAGHDTARDSIAAMLHDNVLAFTEGGHPRGCMVVLAANTVTPQSESVRAHLGQRRAELLAAIRRRVDRGIAEGDVPAGVDTAAVAAFYASIHNGLSIHARDGHDRAALRAVADTAMAAWDAVVAGPAR